jgi:hypothetical protein
MLLVTVEFAVDLGSGLRWRKPTSPCLRIVTDLLQLKYTGLHCSRVLCMWDNTILFCSVLYA